MFTQAHTISLSNPDSKIDGANMGPTWGRQDPGGPHGGHVNPVIWKVAYIPLKRTHMLCVYLFNSVIAKVSIGMSVLTRNTWSYIA